VALSYRLIEFTLFMLLMLEPICLTAPQDCVLVQSGTNNLLITI
jgi:hypothetical protein